ncbi:MAG TPA: PEMT/PEM2 methyltransferase family protein [Blastocatellia bacterium]|nr:PEMT/PEM2 methyltransferase family protein [Blastocatellia bacterium]
MQSALLIIASVIHAAFRLAYFFYIGLTLNAQYLQQAPRTGDACREWLRFKKKASFILNADGLTLGIVAVLGAGTLPLHVSFVWTLVVGIALICAGVGVKVSAYRVVGIKGYYWYNFFCSDGEREYVATGIYKYLDNPMYTLGYLHAFGFALVFRSTWGLVFAAFDVLVLWAFHFAFERPHTIFYRDEMMRLGAATTERDSLAQEEGN